MKKFLTAFGIVFLSAMLGVPSVWAQQAIIIGGVGPLSSPGAAESGKEMRTAMQMAVGEVGTLLGKPVKLEFEDTRGLPEEGSSAMNRLADAGAVGVVGEFHSSVAKAETQVSNQRKLPFIISEAWADELTAQQFPYVFRIAPANSLFYTKVADWIKAIGSRNIVAIVENSDWGLGVDRVLKENLIGAKNIDGENISYTSIVADRTVADFTPQLLTFKSMHPLPDLVIDAFTGTGEYLIVKQAADVGLATTPETAMFAVGTDALYPEYWQTVGDAGDFTITKTGYHPLFGVAPAVKAFMAKFKAKTGKLPTFAAMEAYDSIHVMAKAIKDAGSTKPDAIVAELEKIKYNGVLGTIYFSSSRKPAYMYHEWPGAKAVIVQYTQKGQKYTDAQVLWPAILRP